MKPMKPMNTKEQNEFYESMSRGLKSRGVSDKDIILRIGQVLLEEMFSKEMYTVEVRKSSIHGSGVFATSKILKGDIVTLYPCHIIAYINQEKKEFKYADLDGNCKESDCDSNYCQFLRQNGNDDVYTIGIPSRTSNRIYLGHMINDSLPVKNNINMTPNTSEELGNAYIDYFMLTMNRANCRLISKEYYSYFEASKDIEVGEELLACYGYTQWCKYEGNKFNNLYKGFLDSLPEDHKIYFERLIGRYIQSNFNPIGNNSNIFRK